MTHVNCLQKLTARDLSRSSKMIVLVSQFLRYQKCKMSVLVMHCMKEKRHSILHIHDNTDSLMCKWNPLRGVREAPANQ